LFTGRWPGWIILEARTQAADLHYLDGGRHGGPESLNSSEVWNCNGCKRYSVKGILKESGNNRVTVNQCELKIAAFVVCAVWDWVTV